MEKSKNLLLVEDDPLVVETLETFLVDAGFDVRICATLFDALNYLEMENDIACLIADIQLSDGSNGWDLADHVRARRPDMPVLYITAFDAGDHRNRGVEGSVLIEKPFAPELLVRAVEDAMDLATELPRDRLMTLSYFPRTRPAGF